MRCLVLTLQQERKKLHVQFAMIHVLFHVPTAMVKATTLLMERRFNAIAAKDGVESFVVNALIATTRTPTTLKRYEKSWPECQIKTHE